MPTTTASGTMNALRQRKNEPANGCAIRKDSTPTCPVAALSPGRRANSTSSSPSPLRKTYHIEEEEEEDSTVETNSVEPSYGGAAVQGKTVVGLLLLIAIILGAIFQLSLPTPYHDAHDATARHDKQHAELPRARLSQVHHPKSSPIPFAGPGYNSEAVVHAMAGGAGTGDPRAFRQFGNGYGGKSHGYRGRFPSFGVRARC
ncbi:hypothetical protein DFJ73DRAFT_857671 [Zopfochytrium polystomum]|nr:hypothetical protein DFJ73DRAFT_857671 [Zopfochytrium polystomum]